MFKSPAPPAKAVARTFSRGKQQSALNASTQKVVNQLSALSASRKQPKLLRLCNEDLVKHKTITNAWKVYTRQQHAKRADQLQKQYQSIKTAMTELKELSPELFDAASKPEKKKRFPLEMRVPTDYPPNKPWVYNFARGEK